MGKIFRAFSWKGKIALLKLAKLGVFCIAARLGGDYPFFA